MKPLFERLADSEVVEDLERHRIKLHLLHMPAETKIPLGQFALSYDTSQGVLDTYRCARNTHVIEGVRISRAAPIMARTLAEAKNAINELLQGSERPKARTAADQVIKRIADVERLINTGSISEKEGVDS